MKEAVLVRYHNKTLLTRLNELQQKPEMKTPTSHHDPLQNVLGKQHFAKTTRPDELHNNRNQQRVHTTLDPTQKTATHPTQKDSSWKNTRSRTSDARIHELVHPTAERIRRQTLGLCHDQRDLKETERGSVENEWEDTFCTTSH